MPRIVVFPILPGTEWRDLPRHPPSGVGFAGRLELSGRPDLVGESDDLVMIHDPVFIATQ